MYVRAINKLQSTACINSRKYRARPDSRMLYTKVNQHPEHGSAFPRNCARRESTCGGAATTSPFCHSQREDIRAHPLERLIVREQKVIQSHTSVPLLSLLLLPFSPSTPHQPINVGYYLIRAFVSVSMGTM